MQSARRIVAVLLLLALGLGVPVVSAHAGEMGERAVQAASDAPSPMDCRDGKMAMSSAACSSICISTQAKEVVSVTLTTAAGGFHILSAGRLSGSIKAPEPYPPRSTILS